MAAVWFCVWPQLSLAEHPLQFARLTSAQGLSQNTVTSLLQDQNGLLWIGTQGGLNCYDGYEFKVFHHHPDDPLSPSSESIYSLCQDRRGRLWVGTSTQIELWQGMRKIRSIAADCASAMSEDSRGGMWFGCWGQGLLYLAPDAETPVRIEAANAGDGIPPFAKILGLHADRQGRIWMGLFKQGLFCYYSATGKSEKITLPSLLSEGATDHVHHAILQDHQDRIWVASLQGLYCLENNTWIHYRHDPRNPFSLANDNILTLCLADSHHLWIGTDGNGLDCLDLESGRFHHYPPSHASNTAFPSEKATAILFDNAGMLWAGTYGSGLAKAAPGRIQLTHSAELLPDAGEWVRGPIWCFHEDSAGIIWIGSQSGVHRYDPAQRSAETQRTPSRRLAGLPVRGIWVQNDTTIWIGSQGKGLWLWRPHRDDMTHYLYRHPRAPAINSEVIYDLQPDSAGGLWLACNTGGLFRFDLASRQFERILPPGIGSEIGYWVTDLLLRNRDEIWFTTWSEGLFVIRNGERIPLKMGWLRSPDLDQRYPLLSLFQSGPDELLAGTYGSGFYRLNPADSTSSARIAPAGISDNIVYSFQADRHGQIWYSNNQGLIAFDPVRSYYSTITSPQDGGIQEFNLGASLHSRQRMLFFGGMNGFYRIDPEQEINSVAPQLLIASVHSAHQSWTYYLPPDQMPTLRFNSDDNPFHFKLLPLHLLDPEKNQCACFIKGLDKKWQELGRGRDIILSHLPPGRYRLLLKAANSDGVWSPETGVDLVVTAPLLKSRFFWGLVVTLVLAAAIAFYQGRLYQVRTIERARMQEREGIRTRIAQDFHDELGHRLSKILLFSRTAASEKEQLSETGRAALDKIIENSTSLNKEMRQFLWELDPSKDSLQDLLMELKHFSDDLFDRTDIAFQLQGLVPELEKIILPLDWRSHILRIFKEAMVNIFKHARGCDKVVLEVELLPAQFTLRLINNGATFDTEAITAGEGLKNMRKRAEKIGGELIINSCSSQTAVELLQPYPESSLESIRTHLD